ncbi:hypothetical protein M5689_020125 [Euphorbia peplus]|nr:hypothetical protein M5689_020125 [Euphorbia peplus]
MGPEWQQLTFCERINIFRNGQIQLRSEDLTAPPSAGQPAIEPENNANDDDDDNNDDDNVDADGLPDDVLGDILGQGMPINWVLLAHLINQGDVREYFWYLGHSN